jgi:thiol-disulfide isomerase/thioredoxin
MFRPALLALLALSLYAADEDPATLAIGSRAPEFRLPGVDGKTHALADYAAAKVLVIVFTSNHCPTAQLYEHRLKRLAADYAGKGVAVVAIQPNDPEAVRLDEMGYTDVNDSLEEMQIRAAYRQFNFPYLDDGGSQAVSRAYGPKATPHVFVFDGQRILRYEGRIDNSQREALVKTREARDAIDALLAGRPVAVERTGVFGCTTKWKSKAAGKVAEAKRIAAEPVEVNLVSAAELKQLRANNTGKLLLVNFWATWCGPCLTEMPALQETYRMYRRRDFDMVTVSANFPDERPGVLQALKKIHATTRNLQFGSDDTAAMQAAFEAKWDAGVPFTMLLAPGGKVLYQKLGEVEILDLRRVILANLPDLDYLGHAAHWAAR